MKEEGKSWRWLSEPLRAVSRSDGKRKRIGESVLGNQSESKFSSIITQQPELDFDTGVTTQTQTQTCSSNVRTSTSTLHGSNWQNSDATSMSSSTSRSAESDGSCNVDVASAESASVHGARIIKL